MQRYTSTASSDVRWQVRDRAASNVGSGGKRCMEVFVRITDGGPYVLRMHHGCAKLPAGWAVSWPEQGQDRKWNAVKENTCRAPKAAMEGREKTYRDRCLQRSQSQSCGQFCTCFLLAVPWSLVQTRDKARNEAAQLMGGGSCWY